MLRTYTTERGGHFDVDAEYIARSHKLRLKGKPRWAHRYSPRSSMASNDSNIYHVKLGIIVHDLIYYWASEYDKLADDDNFHLSSQCWRRHHDAEMVIGCFCSLQQTSKRFRHRVVQIGAPLVSVMGHRCVLSQQTPRNTPRQIPHVDLRINRAGAESYLIMPVPWRSHGAVPLVATSNKSQRRWPVSQNSTEGQGWQWTRWLSTFLRISCWAHHVGSMSCICKFLVGFAQISCDTGR